MIEKVYNPNISEQDINIALNLVDAENAEFSDEKLAELAKEKKEFRKKIISDSIVFLIIGFCLFGISLLFQDHWIGTITFFSAPVVLISALVLGILRYTISFTDVSQKDPKKIMGSFLDHEGDYVRAFKLLLPSVVKSISLEDFSEAWKNIYQEEIPNSIKFQENTSCTKCNENINGLWAVLNYQLTDKKVEQGGYFLRCEKCKSVLCPSCYLQIETTGLKAKNRSCPICEKEFEQFLPVFLPDPELSETAQLRLNISVKYEMDGKVARLKAIRTVKFRLVHLVSPTELWEEGQSDLGDRGTVKTIFYNTAVRVGEQWYLLAALPKGRDQVVP